jgi:hypothetical protein
LQERIDQGVVIFGWLDQEPVSVISCYGVENYWEHQNKKSYRAQKKSRVVEIG